MKTTFSVNASFYNKLEQIDSLILGEVKDRLEDIARTAVDYSPVSTGAYVNSFSYTVGAGRPRGKSSEGLPKGANLQAERQQGYDNLMQDLNRVTELEDVQKIELRNNSPHAYDVEFGEGWQRTAGYFVFAKLESIYG